MISFFWNLLFFVIALGILVAVHEWGHFIVARLCKVKVHRFSVGFGKVLFSRTDRQGTEFVLSAIPLGGYVQMLDSRAENVPQDQLSSAFDQKPVGQRMAIIAAGPLINLLFAVFALCLMYMIGVEKVKPVIGEILPNSAATSSNIPIGGEIISIGGKSTSDWNQVNLEMISHIGRSAMNVMIKQPDSSFEKNYTINLTGWNFDANNQSVMASLGIVPFRPAISNTIGLIQEGGAAEKYGLQVGDSITALNGSPVTWDSLVEFVQANPNKMIEVAYVRDGESMLQDVLIGTRVHDGNIVGHLGILGTQAPWPENMVIKRQLSVIDALAQGVAETWRLTGLSFALIGKLLTGDLSINTLSGPISIAQGAGASASYGLVYFLSFLALVSVNLGVINLLPLPVLDGGHLMYFLVEWVKGSPVPEQIQQLGYRLGAAVVLMIMVIAVFNDLGRI